MRGEEQRRALLGVTEPAQGVISITAHHQPEHMPGSVERTMKSNPLAMIRIDDEDQGWMTHDGLAGCSFLA